MGKNVDASFVIGFDSYGKKGIPLDKEIKCENRSGKLDPLQIVH